MSELMPGDAVLRPESHVEMFIRWEVKGVSYIQAGCHNSNDGCSHRLVDLSYYTQNGYFGCRPHASYVCGGSSGATANANANATSTKPVN